MTAAQLNDNQRKMLKTNILKSFMKLIESSGLKDDPDMKEAYQDIKSDLRDEMLIEGGKHERKKVS